MYAAKQLPRTQELIFSCIQMHSELLMLSIRQAQIPKSKFHSEKAKEFINFLQDESLINIANSFQAQYLIQSGEI